MSPSSQSPVTTRNPQFGYTAGSSIVLYPVGGSSAATMREIRSLSEADPVIAPDLPGHGASDGPQADVQDLLELCVSWLEALLDALSVQHLTIVAIREAAPVAMRLADSARVTEVALLDRLLCDRVYASAVSASNAFATTEAVANSRSPVRIVRTRDLTNGDRSRSSLSEVATTDELKRLSHFFSPGGGSQKQQDPELH